MRDRIRIIFCLALLLSPGWILAKPLPQIKIVIVHATDRDDKKFGAFPWPRSAHADLIEKLESSGAKWVVLKFIFDAPRSGAGDEKLISAAKKYGNVIVPSACGVAQQGEKGDSQAMAVSVIGNQTNHTKFLSYVNCTYPFKALADVSAGVGSIDCKSKDRELLKIPLAIQIDNKLYPSLPLITVAKAFGYSSKNITARDGQMVMGDKSFKMDEEGMMNLKLSVPGKLYKTYDYTDILDGKYVPEDIRGSIVVIGYGGSRFPSDFVTSTSKKHNGTDINADAIRSLWMELGN